MGRVGPGGAGWAASGGKRRGRGAVAGQQGCAIGKRQYRHPQITCWRAAKGMHGKQACMHARICANRQARVGSGGDSRPAAGRRRSTHLCVLRAHLRAAHNCCHPALPPGQPAGEVQGAGGWLRSDMERLRAVGGWQAPRRQRQRHATQYRVLQQWGTGQLGGAHRCHGGRASPAGAVGLDRARSHPYGGCKCRHGVG